MSEREHQQPEPQVGAFLDWLISMDDPDSPEGLPARREVTLTRIIERARAARGVPTMPCRESEGMTGIDCFLSADHFGPHQGWHDDEERDGYVGYSMAIAWPVPDRPRSIVLEPDGGQP